MSTAGKKNLPQPSLKDNISNYLKSVKVEWYKITWPEKRQVIVETIVVLIVVFFFATLVFAYDQLFGFLTGLLTKMKP